MNKITITFNMLLVRLVISWLHAIETIGFNVWVDDVDVRLVKPFWAKRKSCHFWGIPKITGLRIWL